MKDTWKKVISKLEEETKAAVSKPDFLYLFGMAYNESFTEATVKAAFQVTGVYPFNRNVISATQMKPSTTSSVKGEFLLPQPSPVRAILVAWGQNNPVASTSQAVLTSSPSISRRRICDEDIDPLLHTPSKRLRTMHAGLKAMASGSFLISDELYKSSTPILEPVLEVPPAALPQPNWQLAGSPEKMWVSQESLQIENQHLRESLHRAPEHVQVRDQVIERNNAQLLYQNLRREKAAVKTRNADARSARKEAMAAVEKEWVRIKEQHDIDVKAWEVECQRLASEKVPKWSWPKKPVRPRKPKLPSSVEEIVEEDDDDDEEEDDGEDNDGSG